MNWWKRIKSNRLVLGFIIFDILALVALIILNVVNSFRTATVDIAVVPFDAIVRINGKKCDNNSSYNLHPKENVKVEVSHPELEAKTFTIDLKKGETSLVRNFLVGKNNDFSYYTMKAHHQDYLQLEKITSFFPDDEKLQDFVKSYKKKIAIFDVLPFEYAHYDENYNYTEYSVKRSEECEETLCLEIVDVNGDNEEKAKELVKQNGFNPDNYKYIYNYKPIVELNE